MPALMQFAFRLKPVLLVMAVNPAARFPKSVGEACDFLVRWRCGQSHRARVGLAPLSSAIGFGTSMCHLKLKIQLYQNSRRPTYKLGPVRS